MMSFRQSTEMCLFLSFVVIVLIQENTCESDSSSRDDPKSVDAASSSFPDENDVKFFPMKADEGPVKGLLHYHPLRADYGNESLGIKDDSGRALERVYNLSSTNLERRNCDPGQPAMFVLNPSDKQTYVGCFRDKKISDYCPEFNTQGVQPNFQAPCKITFTLCDASYQASEGYTFPKCFEIYGGISSPNEGETCTCKTQARTALLESERNTCAPPTPCPKSSVEFTYLNVLLVLINVMIVLCCKYWKCCKKRDQIRL